jgi:hypothetical protein
LVRLCRDARSDDAARSGRGNRAARVLRVDELVRRRGPAGTHAWTGRGATVSSPPGVCRPTHRNA